MANITKMHLENSDDFNRAAGGKITATVTFNEDVMVAGTPVINLTCDMSDGPAVSAGNEARVQWLEYVSGSGTDELLFEYTLAADDVKSGQEGDKIGIGTNAVALNGGTIKDRAGADANIDNSQAHADAFGILSVYAPA